MVGLFMLLLIAQALVSYAQQTQASAVERLRAPPKAPPTLSGAPPPVVFPSKESLPPNTDPKWWKPIYATAPEALTTIPTNVRVMPIRKVDETPKPSGTTFQVVLPGGKITRIPGTTADTPQQLLTVIEKETGYAASAHRLDSGLVDLDPSLPLKAQGVPANAMLTLTRLPLAIAQLPNGKTMSLFGDQKTLVSQLKKNIEERTNIPTRYQELRYKESVLQDSRTLHDEKVPIGSQLTLTQIPAVTVKTKDATIRIMDAPVNAPVRELKSLIAKKTDVLPNLQELRYNGALLDDAESLAAQNVPAGSTIDLDILPGLQAVLPDEKVIPVYVLPTDTVAKVKEFLLKEANLKPEEIECVYDGKTLKDSENLANQDVPHGAKVYVHKKPSLHVIIPEGKTIDLYISLKATVDAAKQRLEEDSNISKEQQALYYNTNLLKDEQGFEEQGVPYGAEIVLKKLPSLILKLPNGVEHPFTGDRQTSISTVKDTAARLLKKKADDIALSYNGHPLNTEKTIRNENLPFGAKIDVVNKETVVHYGPTLDALRVFLENGRVCVAILIVKHLGTTLSLPSVTIDDTPLAARKAASAAAGTSISALYYNRKQLLEDGRSLAAQNVPNGALLNASTKPYEGLLSAPQAGYNLLECDVERFGEECFSDPVLQKRYREFEKKKHWVMVVYAAILFALGFLSQSGLKLLTLRITESRDRFIHEFLETTYRSVTIVALVIAIIDILLYFDIFELQLEKILFEKFTADPALGIHENVLTETFGFMSQRVQFFLVTYLVVVLLLAGTAWRLSVWLKKADHHTGDHFTSSSASKAEKTYAALRYEFADSVAIMAVGGLDPEYYNFMEYFRACYLQTITKLVRFPTLMLFFCFFGVFLLVPLTSYHKSKMVLTMLLFTLVPIMVMIFVLYRAWAVSKKILPRHLDKYLTLRYTYALQEAPVSETELEEVGPIYKSSPISRRTICSACWVRTLYKTRYPSKHEALFWLWRAGPAVLERLLESALFLGLCVIAQTFYLINAEWSSWSKMYGPWPLLTFLVLLGLSAATLPFTLWKLTIATSTGGRIREDVVSEVWELQRSQTVRRIAHLIDALRIEATLYEIVEAGDDFMKELAKRAVDVEPEVAEQNTTLWENLDDDGDGKINLPQLYSFLTRQGLNIKSEAETSKWFSVFDLNRDGGIDQNEFSIIITIVKQLTGGLMDDESVKALLVKNFEMSDTAPDAINEASLLKLFKELHIHTAWGRNNIIHLLDLVGADKQRRELSVAQFVEGLKRLEAGTMATLTHAVQELKGASPPGF